MPRKVTQEIHMYVSQRNYWRCFEEVITWIPKMWRTTWKLDASDFWNNDDLIHPSNTTWYYICMYHVRLLCGLDRMWFIRWVRYYDRRWLRLVDFTATLSSWTSSSESQIKNKRVFVFPEVMLLIYRTITITYRSLFRKPCSRQCPICASLFTLRGVISWST